MPLPKAIAEAQSDLVTLEGNITAIEGAITALPATPLEADLPDIVAIITDLQAAANTLNSTVAAALEAIGRVRINQ